jgi:hypothetical protein
MAVVAGAVPADVGTPPGAIISGTRGDEKKSASKTVTDTIIGTVQAVTVALRTAVLVFPGPSLLLLTLPISYIQCGTLHASASMFEEQK